MHGSENNISFLFLFVLIVGCGVAAMNGGRGSSIDYGRARVSTNHVYDVSDTRTFLAFNALASSYNPRRASADLE
jgi:hypothetical protein